MKFDTILKKVGSLRRAVLIVIGINAILCAALLAVYKFYPGMLVDIRDSLYTGSTADADIFRGGPVKMSGFRNVSPELVVKWKPRIRKLEFIDSEAIESTSNIVDKVQRIVRAISKGGGPGCGKYSGLERKMKWIQSDEGNGCCSDHAEVFVAVAAVFGITVREVAHSHHVFAEFYAPNRGRWIWVDPQYAVMAREPGTGTYLSAFELRTRFLEERGYEFEFFGSNSHPRTLEELKELPFYDEALDFRDLILTRGNNVFEQVRFRKTWSGAGVLPKPVVQFLAFTLGPKPGYLAYRDDFTTLENLVVVYRLVLGFGILWVLLNVTLLGVGFVAQRKR